MQERVRSNSMKQKTLIVTSTLVALIVLTTCVQGFFFANICIVTGTIQFHGKPAQGGSTVAAFIGEDKVAESLTRDNGSYELKIPEYDPTKPDIKGYRTTDDVVQVKLDGKIAKPTFSPTNENLKVDLRVETTLDVKLSTWGKIKALFK